MNLNIFASQSRIAIKSSQWVADLENNFSPVWALVSVEFPSLATFPAPVNCTWEAFLRFIPQLKFLVVALYCNYGGTC